MLVTNIGELNRMAYYKFYRDGVLVDEYECNEKDAIFKSQHEGVIAIRSGGW